MLQLLLFIVAYAGEGNCVSGEAESDTVCMASERCKLLPAYTEQIKRDLEQIVLAHHRRDLRHPGPLRRAQATLPRNQSIAAFGFRTDDHRLQNASLANRLRQILESLLFEMLSGLLGVY